MKKIKYRKLFETEDERSEILIAAYYQAADIRKFEIDMYWKRATYFWALIAVAFAAFFAVSSAEHLSPQDKNLYLSAISSAGFIFTFAWFSVNKGSKYWQENWENHLDLLEDKITGPLYKTKLERPQDDSGLEKLIIGPQPYSVSKINQIIAVFTMILWLFFIGSVFLNKNTTSTCNIMLYIPIIMAAVFILFIVLYGKSHQSEMNPKFSVRVVNHPDDN
ncbi:RipA family octameric membrane protein [Aeromonas enterica]